MGKFIAAMDHSGGSTGGVLERYGQAYTEEDKRDKVHEMRLRMVNSPDFNSDNIWAAILYKDTVERGMVPILKEKGIQAYLKIDSGTNEDGTMKDFDLNAMVNFAVKHGCTGTKMRSIIKSSELISTVLHQQFKLAEKIHAWGLMPIIEPEVLMDGNHSSEDCFKKTSEVIKKCFEELILHKVDLKGIILKPNMILAGNTSKDKIANEEVAKLTLECLKNSVPSEVPGIAFLSGGQSELEATENLNLINKLNDTNFIMSYSYGRALQQSALKFWSKDIQNIEGTQKVFNHRAKMNTLAAQGKWSKDLEI